MPLCIQAGRIDEMGVGHPQALRPLVHHPHERLFTPRDRFRQRNRRIVRTGDRCCLEQVVYRELLALLKPDLASAH